MIRLFKTALVFFVFALGFSASAANVSGGSTGGYEGPRPSPCVESFTSQPICMNTLSAEKNCEKDPQEAEAIHTCLVQFFGGHAEVQAEFRDIVYRNCLATIVTGSESTKNKSNCE